MSEARQWASVFFLKQARKIGTSQLLCDTEFNHNLLENKMSYAPSLLSRKIVFIRNGVQKKGGKFCQLIKILNEARGVKGEGKTRFYIFNKKVYSIFKKHIKPCNTEVNVLFCLRWTEWVVPCGAQVTPDHVVRARPIRSPSRFNYVKCQIAIN